MKNLIGISGKIGSGKDTVGKIIQYLVCKQQTAYDGTLVNPTLTYNEFLEPNRIFVYNWKIKKYAFKLKQIASLLLGIPVEDFEKREVKDRVLGEEWKKWKLQTPSIIDKSVTLNIIFNSEEEAWEYNKTQLGFNVKVCNVYSELLTIRQFLQELGTEAMRNVIHPNVWVNALFANYVNQTRSFNILDGATSTMEKVGEELRSNWIITDVRFPNEKQAIEERNGIVIRVNNFKQCCTCEVTFRQEGNCPNCESGNWVYGTIDSQHPSETALDDATFDYVIDNNGTIEELINKVEEILIKEGVI